MEIFSDACYVAVPRLIIDGVYHKLKETMKVAVCLSVCLSLCTFATALFAV